MKRCKVIEWFEWFEWCSPLIIAVVSFWKCGDEVVVNACWATYVVLDFLVTEQRNKRRWSWIYTRLFPSESKQSKQQVTCWFLWSLTVADGNSCRTIQIPRRMCFLILKINIYIYIRRQKDTRQIADLKLNLKTLAMWLCRRWPMMVICFAFQPAFFDVRPRCVCVPHTERPIEVEKKENAAIRTKAATKRHENAQTRCTRHIVSSHHLVCTNLRR